MLLELLRCMNWKIRNSVVRRCWPSTAPTCLAVALHHHRLQAVGLAVALPDVVEQPPHLELAPSDTPAAVICRDAE